MERMSQPWCVGSAVGKRLEEWLRDRLNEKLHAVARNLAETGELDTHDTHDTD